MTIVNIQAVVFDLGGVVIDWDPKLLYRKVFDGDEAKMEMFLSQICPPDWNERQDGGRSLAAALTGLMHFGAYAQSARLAGVLGPFPGFAVNREPMMKVVEMHRDAVRQIHTSVPGYLLDAVRLAADRQPSGDALFHPQQGRQPTG